MSIKRVFSEVSIEYIAAFVFTASVFVFNICINMIKRFKEKNNKIFSPDKKKICYVKTKRRNRDIFVIDIESNTVFPVAIHPADDESPVWSPDSTRIAFVSNRRGSRNIYVINWDGTGLIELTNDGNDNYSPFWSTDCSKIIFETKKNGSYMIKIISIEGKRKNAVRQD